MQRVKIAVIGAGGVAQVAHIPNLMKLKDRFDVTGVFDPSAQVRGFIADEYGLTGFDTLEALLSSGIDAVLIASPDALHREQILTALARGLHVFCEKPLCYATEDIDDVIAARDAAGRVLQVGYMKRFDPGYEAAMRLMPGTAKTLRYVSVEVNDPDAWPFVAHHKTFQGGDVAADLITTTHAKQAEQVARAVPLPMTPIQFRGFTGAYCSALVHDVNAVHGLLDALAVPEGQIVGAQLFAGGDGGQGTVRLLQGQAIWNMVHLTVPALSDYRERITLYFDDASVELEFPSPYLMNQPTRLTIRTSDGAALSTHDIRSSYEEAFVEELKGFWAAIGEGAPVRNTAEHARRDMKLLAGMAAHHISHTQEASA